jgi:hypothetical protein
VCWGQANICGVNEWLQSVVTGPTNPESIPDRVHKGLERVIDVVTAPFLYVGSQVSRLFSGATAEDMEDFRDEARQNLSTNIIGVRHAETFLNVLPTACVPNIDAALTLLPALTAVGTAARLTGAPVDYLGQSLIYTYHAANPQYLPDQPAYDTQYLANLITKEEWECGTKAHGNHPLPWYRTVLANQVRPGVLDNLNLWLRGNIDLPRLNTALRELGVIDPARVDDYKKLVQQLPPPSDAIRFAVRDAFDPKKSGRAEMMKEFNEQVGLRELFEAVGLRKYTINDATGKPLEVDVPFLYWLASYDEISPTQSFEMLHRFRENRVKRYGIPDGRGGTVYPRVYTMADVNSLLKEKDYNPKDRTELAAISYRLPGRIDVKNFYKRSAFGKPLGREGFDRTDPANPIPRGVAEVEMRERFRDMGYAEPDANVQAWDAAVSLDEQRGRRGVARQLRVICTQYSQGMIGREDAVRQSTPLVGGREEAERVVLLCNAEYAARDVAFALQGIRKKYLTGERNKDQTRTLLTRVGVRGERIDSFLRTWDYQREVRTREVTAQQILQWFTQKIIKGNEAVDRLVNLKYDKEDARRMVRVAELGDLARTAKEVERAENAARRQRDKVRSRQEREVREQERLQVQRFNKFLSAFSDKNLKAWWEQGLIEPVEIRNVLILKGWRELEADRWLLANDPSKG